jgi:hypothetical protein
MWHRRGVGALESKKEGRRVHACNACERGTSIIEAEGCLHLEEVESGIRA